MVGNRLLGTQEAARQRADEESQQRETTNITIREPLSRGQILAKLLKAGWKQEHLEPFSLIRVFRVKVLKSFRLL